MPGSRRTPAGRPSGGRPAGGRSSSGSGTTRRPTRPASRSGDRVRTSTRPRAGVETGRQAAAEAAARTARGAGGGTGDGGDRSGSDRQRSGGGRGRPSVTGRAAVLALVVAVLLVSYAYPLRTWWEQHSAREALADEAARLNAERERLERELMLWEDPAFVAAQARERLGFVMPGEQGYVIIPDEDDANTQTVDGLPPAGRGQWYERLWSSVEAADAEQAAGVAPQDDASDRITRGADGMTENDGDDSDEGAGR